MICCLATLKSAASDSEDPEWPIWYAETGSLILLTQTEAKGDDVLSFFI